MKVQIAAAVAVAAAGASAQNLTASPPITYTTVTYDDCPSSSMETMITVTNGITVTLCPMCEMSTGAPVVPHTTVYTTTYMSLCPTGTVPATYTITESCTAATPTWHTGASDIPPGYTTNVKTCTTGCGSMPTAVTITEPCGCTETGSYGSPTSNAGAVSQATSPAGSGSGSGSEGSGTSAPGSGAGSGKSMPAASPAATPTLGSGPGAGGSAPYPTPTGTTAECSGAGCRMPAAASGYPSGVTYGNTTGIQQWTGAASSTGSSFFLSAAVVLFIGVMGFAL